VEVYGTEGRIELQGDTLVLTGKDGERRWPGLPALSDGSHHPEWFHKVAERFVAAVAGNAQVDANLAEAALCCEIEHLARESSRCGGVPLPLSRAPVIPTRLSGSRLRGRASWWSWRAPRCPISRSRPWWRGCLSGGASRSPRRARVSRPSPPRSPALVGSF